MIRKIVSVEVDTRVVPASPDREIIAWLDGDLVRWDDHGLIVRTSENEDAHARIGWTLERWPDGQLGVVSRAAAARKYEPVTE